MALSYCRFSCCQVNLLSQHKLLVVQAAFTRPLLQLSQNGHADMTWYVLAAVHVLTEHGRSTTYIMQGSTIDLYTWG